MAKRLTPTEKFTEALANGWSVKDAAAQVGWTAAQGNVVLSRIRKELGEQAV